NFIFPEGLKMQHGCLLRQSWNHDVKGYTEQHAQHQPDSKPEDVPEGSAPAGCSGPHPCDGVARPGVGERVRLAAHELRAWNKDDADVVLSTRLIGCVNQLLRGLGRIALVVLEDGADLRRREHVAQTIAAQQECSV